MMDATADAHRIHAKHRRAGNVEGTCVAPHIYRLERVPGTFADTLSAVVRAAH